MLNIALARIYNVPVSRFLSFCSQIDVVQPLVGSFCETARWKGPEIPDTQIFRSRGRENACLTTLESASPALVTFAFGNPSVVLIHRKTFDVPRPFCGSLVKFIACNLSLLGSQMMRKRLGMSSGHSSQDSPEFGTLRESQIKEPASIWVRVKARLTPK